MSFGRHGQGPEAALPPFEIRRHPRARRVRLRVTPNEGLVVTIPPRAPVSVAVEAVAERRRWVEEALARVAGDRALLALGAEALLPSEVEFGMSGERWAVEYVHALTPGRVTVREVHGRLEARGDVADAEACLAALRRWLDRAARARLRAEIERESRAQGLPFGKLSVRAQKGRWGSCTARGDVSLNRALVFLPAPLARSVVLHELVHTLHCDHSAAFWSELERRDPACRAERARVRDAWNGVPLWARP